jgi:hypothetical protein
MPRRPDGEVSQKELIVNEVVAILDFEPDGMKAADLVKEVKSRVNDISESNIKTYLPILAQSSDIISKLRRGTYILSKYVDADDVSEAFDDNDNGENETLYFSEKKLYESISDYCKEFLYECSSTVILKDYRLFSGFFAPDIVGTLIHQKELRSLSRVEIVSFEVVLDMDDLMIALGRALFYKAFSHRVYLFIPKAEWRKAYAWLDTTMINAGIGLGMYERNNTGGYDFALRVRATKGDPNHTEIDRFIQALSPDIRDSLSLL